MRARRLAATVAVAVLVLAGCGDDDGDGDAAGTSTSSPPTSVESTTTSTEVPTTETSITDTEGSCPDDAAVPAEATDVVSATLPFDGDGDGVDDQLTTFHHEDMWWVQATWSTGGSAAVTTGDTPLGIRALGGHDLDGDGIDEAWVAVAGPASGNLVALFRVDGCGIAPVLDVDTGAPFELPVTSSIGAFSGASCNSIGDISLVTGQLVDEDGGEYEASEVPYTYDPATGQVSAGPGDGGSVGVDEVGALATLDCGDLADAL